MPKELYLKLGAAGLLPAVCGAPWPEEFVGPGGPAEFDAFHSLIFVDEIGRCGSGGILWAIMGGLGIGLPPVIHFGSEYLKQKCVQSCLRGEQFICLAISEPLAGSDVANLRTTAVKDPSGEFYVVNGEKKWITSGCSADFFTVAVRTGGPGAKGISLLLVERETPGVETVRMKTMGWWMSNTAFVTFSDVKVPVANLIGEENGGFRAIMYNFSEYMLAAAPAGAED